jgi:Type II CAAX prenyl endopeptidase Rce1-like
MLMNVVEIGPFGWLHLIFFGVYIPVLVLRSQRQLASGRPIPWVRRYFLSGAVAQLLFLLISLGVARLERIELAPRQLPRPAGVVAGAVMLAVLIAFMRARWRRNVERGLPIVRMFMPRDRVERAQWTTPSALAGVGEEITWRGVQFVLVWRLVGDPILSAAVCAALFAVVHAVQGWRSTPIFMAIAGGCHVVVWLSGSLYAVMVVHFVYDLAAGLNYGRLGRELGYEAAGIESQT